MKLCKEKSSSQKKSNISRNVIKCNKIVLAIGLESRKLVGRIISMSFTFFWLEFQQSPNVRETNLIILEKSLSGDEDQVGPALK